MNKVLLMGRLVRDSEVRWTTGEQPMAVARFTLAVDRRGNRNSAEGQTADFINCVAFGKLGEIAERYLHKGIKIALSGRIQTGSYTNRDGQKVYTTDIVVEEIEFAERKNASSGNSGNFTDFGGRAEPSDNDGFMHIPSGIDEELPFN